MLLLSQKLDIEILTSYYSHVLRLPMNFFGRRHIGEIITRFNDANTIKNVLSGTLLSVVLDVIMVSFVGIALYILNSQLFTITMIIVLINIILIYIFKQPYKIFNRKMMVQHAQMSSTLIESLSGIETIKISNSHEKQESKINEAYGKVLNTGYLAGVLSNIQGSIANFVNNIANLVILFVGAKLIISGKMTLGDLMAFNSLVGMFLGPVGNLVDLQMSFQEVAIASDRLIEIIDIETEEEKDDGKIELNNSTFPG